jgi:hypothetical protein
LNSTEPPPAERADRRRLAWSLVGAAWADDGVDGLTASLQRVCRAATSRLPVKGAAIHLMTTGSEGVAAFSDATTLALAELQFATNEGPGQHAFRIQRPVLVADLDSALVRWPGFASLALESGVRAVFSFPLQEGAVSFGVLELYADRTGPLHADNLAMAAAFARAATEVIFDGGTITAAGDLGSGLRDSMRNRAPIHQAQGMVMVDLGVTLAEALTRMRARAFARNITLLELAYEVIAGTLTTEMWADGDGTP